MGYLPLLIVLMRLVLFFDGVTPTLKGRGRGGRMHWERAAGAPAPRCVGFSYGTLQSRAKPGELACSTC